MAETTIKPQVGRSYKASSDTPQAVNYQAWWETMKSWAVGLQGAQISGTDVVDRMANIELEVR